MEINWMDMWITVHPIVSCRNKNAMDKPNNWESIHKTNSNLFEGDMGSGINHMKILDLWAKVDCP